MQCTFPSLKGRNFEVSKIGINGVIVEIIEDFELNKKVVIFSYGYT